MNGNLVIVMGESASGKDTIVKYLKRYFRMKDVCSHTTRPPRKGEVNGREHWFDTQDEFDELMRTGDICAYAKLEDEEIGEKGYEYCSTLEDVLNADLYVLDPNGLADMLSRHPELHTFVLYVHASKEVRKQRALLRDAFQEVVFETRYANEHKQFDEFFRNGKYDTAIINEDISESALCATVRDILLKEGYKIIENN